MSSATARRQLDSLASSWRRGQIGVLVLRTLAFALPLVTFASVVVSDDAARPWAMLVAVLLSIALVWFPPRTRWADATLVARHLDRHLPSLEESATLMLRGDETLTTLERLQRDRVAPVLASIGVRETVPASAVRRASGEALAAVAVALLVIGFATLAERDPDGALPRDRGPAPVPHPLDTVGVTVVPPAYTGLESSRQNELEIRAEEGAEVIWSVPAGRGTADLSVELITGEGAARPFAEVGESLELTTRVVDSVVYRLSASQDETPLQQTGFHRLEVVPDRPPRLAVVVPSERLTLIRADTQALELEIEAEDDYGLGAAELVATLALGAGELVEFRERRIALDSPAGERRATLRHRFDLGDLDLGPAAELYFHVEAFDNREPEPNLGRSPTTIVRVEGEAATSVGLGEGLPIILPPTYFRSQRQIIIDTEKLIAESPGLDPAEIRRRSEELAADQRALRMRYGALMGEEFVSGQAVEAGHGETGEDEHEEHEDLHVEEGEGAMTEALQALPEGMFHQHDSAEIATYFSSATRDQLRRVLAEMWDAEGRLRVINPEGALPFENRALVLLKELQQASRIYVQKVGFEAPPLEPEERRLTGELDEIRTRFETLTPPEPPAVEAAARSLLARLESLDTSRLEEVPSEVTTLLGVVSRLALRRPEAAEALGALTDLETGVVPEGAALRGLQATLWSLLPTPDPAPMIPPSTDDPLSRGYRERRSQGGAS